jgi:putative methyltransferase (TIGR04325 family)
LNVIDFGGAAGAHYFTIRALLPSEYQLRWVVVETPAMAAGGAKHLANDELSFTAKLQEAEAKLGHIDLLHSSGTLQCLPDPIEQLRSMMLLPADHILLGADHRRSSALWDSWLLFERAWSGGDARGLR